MLLLGLPAEYQFNDEPNSASLSFTSRHLKNKSEVDMRLLIVKLEANGPRLPSTVIVCIINQKNSAEETAYEY